MNIRILIIYVLTICISQANLSSQIMFSVELKENQGKGPHLLIKKHKNQPTDKTIKTYPSKEKAIQEFQEDLVTQIKEIAESRDFRAETQFYALTGFLETYFADSTNSSISLWANYLPRLYRWWSMFRGISSALTLMLKSETPVHKYSSALFTHLGTPQEQYLRKEYDTILPKIRQMRVIDRAGDILESIQSYTTRDDIDAWYDQEKVSNGVNRIHQNDTLKTNLGQQKNILYLILLLEIIGSIGIKYANRRSIRIAIYALRMLRTHLMHTMKQEILAPGI